MSTTRSYPIINTIISDISAAKTEQHDYITDVLNIINGVTTTYVTYDVFGIYAPKLPDSMTDKVVYAMLNFNEPNPRQGFLFFRGNKKYWFVSFDGACSKCFPYELEPGKVKGYDNQCLSMLEIREVIKAAVEASGELNPRTLATILEGNTGVVVDLNEAETKVEVHLDMTGASINSLLVSGSGGESVSWKTLEQALKAVPGEDEGKFMTLLSTGIAWNNIPTPEKIKLNTLTLTASSGVYTSSQTFTEDFIHVAVECEMSGTHACFGVDLHRYDSSVSYAVARVNWGGTISDVLCRIDEENHVVLDLANLTGLTTVYAKYYKYN